MRMKKLSLSKLLEFGGSALRPQGPSPANIHQFPHHGLFSTTGGYKPKASNTSPYPDKDSDLSVGDQAAEEEPEDEELPLDEFFKFTKSANDNTSFHRPPTYGRGAMAAYGKSAKSFDSYDTSNSDNEVRQQTVKGRKFQRVGTFQDPDDATADLQENPGLRQRHPRHEEGDSSTKQPWANGMPGHDKKDIFNGDAKIDELIKDLEKEQKQEDSLEEMFFPKLKESHRDTDWADSSYSRISNTRTAHAPSSDLNFWEILDKDNRYLLTNPDKVNNGEDEEK